VTGKCPTCGRPHIDPKRVRDALRLVDAGVRQSTAARAAGISRQRLNQLVKARRRVAGRRG
jgi:predicted DNA-binding protein (UPF0251 family)